MATSPRPAVAIISAGLDNDYGHPHRSTLDILTHDKKDALILDFFAGSGTTLHATMHLNAHDEGRRRCVQVTNSVQRAESATRLFAKAGAVGITRPTEAGELQFEPFARKRTHRMKAETGLYRWSTTTDFLSTSEAARSLSPPLRAAQ